MRSSVTMAGQYLNVLSLTDAAKTTKWEINTKRFYMRHIRGVT